MDDHTPKENMASKYDIFDFFLDLQIVQSEHALTQREFNFDSSHAQEQLVFDFYNE